MKKLFIISTIFILISKKSYSQVEPVAEAFLENFYIDGGDTIWIEYTDTTEIIEGARMPGVSHSTDIGVSLSGNIGQVNNQLFGIHIAGLFKPKNMPSGIYGEDQWELMSELCPTILRFPGGEESKFMHLLHTIDPSDAPTTRSVGYGYDINEIIRYFDYTDGNINVSGNPLTDPIEDLVWIDEAFRSNFNRYRIFFAEQQLVTESYIDQFILLIDKIQDENPGHIVNVVVSLNILSESPLECKSIINYLQNGAPLIEGGNGVTSINVIGVEMGNECYSGFFAKAVGFTYFQNYWEYINGDEVTGFDLSNVLEGDISLDHDFLATFKGRPDFDIKVGLVGYDSPDPGNSNDYALKLTDIVDIMPISSNWNYVLSTHYNSLIPVEGTPFSRKAFDAVILHPYYGTYNYKDELESFIVESYSCGNKWEYETYDTRLDDAFDFMKVKFKSFIKSEFKESYMKWNEDLQFNLTIGSGGKELWTTEWNFKDQDNSASNQQRLRSYSNTFMQGAFDFEWYLKNVKMNFDNDYRNNFFTLATMHNYGGGGWAEMLSPANKRERINYGIDISPYSLDDLDPNKRNYYLPRTNYYVFELLRDISYKNLEYVKTNFSMNILNPNVQPTMFIERNNIAITTDDYLYLYFSNIKDIPQTYILNINTLGSLYPGSESVNFGNSEMHAILANQPYSSSGKMALFEMNLCYSTGLPENYHPLEYLDFQNIISPFTDFEAMELEHNCDESIAENQCLTVPKYSLGYIKIPIIVSYPGERSDTFSDKADLSLFRVMPNPTSNYLKIDGINLKSDNYYVAISNVDGKILISIKLPSDKVIDVSSLQDGLYNIELISIEKATKHYSQTFIKIH